MDACVRVLLYTRKKLQIVNQIELSLNVRESIGLLNYALNINIHAQKKLLTVDVLMGLQWTGQIS